jgi:hypothetical protein
MTFFHVKLPTFQVVSQQRENRKKKYQILCRTPIFNFMTDMGSFTSSGIVAIRKTKKESIKNKNKIN